MNELLKTTIIGLFFGTFGTTIGGIIGITLKNTSNRLLGTILAFASGLMSAIVCFELIPEAMQISNINIAILGIMFGIIIMFLCDIIVDKKISQQLRDINKELKIKNHLLKTGIIVSIGLAIHNIPEGLAIGSGYESSVKLGLSLALAICLHDIPEGMSMAIPMKNGGISTMKVIFYVILSGITTGIGAFLGCVFGEISKEIIAICLSFAAGAMIYIVSGELIPESNKLYKGRITSIGNMIGFLIGILVINL